MADPKKSVYARLASRFAHLALGAKEEEEEDKKDARAEGEPEAAEDEPEDEKEKSKKAKKSRADRRDGDDDEPEAAEPEEEDDEDASEEGKQKKALCIVNAHREGRAFERARWAAVMSSAEAKGRVPLACSLLTDTSMSAEKVRAALLASPTEGRQGLAARMAAVPRPEVGAGPAVAPDATTPKGQAALIVGAYNKVVGSR